MKENILTCVDSSAYAASVCDLAAWASAKLDRPVELLHVVQRKNAVAERHDLSGAIGLGVKSTLLEELTRLEEADARLQIERGRALLATAKERLTGAGVVNIEVLHRHGGIVETILEREAEACIVVIGKRGASHEFATDHIGSKIERVVRASNKSILIASRIIEPPRVAVLAYDGSKAAERALERAVNSPLFKDLPAHIVMADDDDQNRGILNRGILDAAVKKFGSGREVRTTLGRRPAENLISSVVNETPGAILIMGAYGHSPLRTLIIGSTTTTMIRSVHVPILLTR